MLRIVYALAVLASMVFTMPGMSQADAGRAVLFVPPGNRHAVQPPVPDASAARTRQRATTYEAKYRKIYALLKEDAHVRSLIIKTAQAYGLEPVHIVAALVGEHTYNVDVYDRLQTYYIKGITWAGQGVAFAYKGESISDFVNRPQFAPCRPLSDSYRLWTCREEVWNTAFRNKTVEGRAYPDHRFSAVFFQPFYAGQTFGLGQINPLTALKMSDMVHDISGLPALDASHGSQLYHTIMDPDLALPYIAAIIRQSIDCYRDIADFDISRNPGITATLYNVGGAEQRARALALTNSKRKARGQAALLPQENYYGWFVNSKLDELQQLF